MKTRRSLFGSSFWKTHRTSARPRARLWLEILEDRTTPSAVADFNGDGFSDLAVGVPGEDNNAGAVNIIYGSASGLTAANNQLWTQNSSGIADTAEPDDQFGRTLAAGDFNNDGYVDLAIGVPFEDITAQNDGAVQVIYGSSAGLGLASGKLVLKFQYWDQAALGRTNETGDNFGTALAVGDFNRDGFDDLAVGVAGETTSGQNKAGAVVVIHGSSSGLTASANQAWSQDSSGILGGSEAFDEFGAALATGDFNRDGADDLAIGVPGEAVGSAGTGAGAVSVIYGSLTGLTATANQLWHQDSPNIPGGPEAGDRFGSVLAAGDFTGEGFSDLAIGVPLEDLEDKANAGIVHVLFGRPGGLSDIDNQNLEDGSFADANDQFGSALAAGDFQNDGKDDLVVGISRDDTVGGLDDAGEVRGFPGGATGLSLSHTWNQDSHQVNDTAEAFDRYGVALGTADFNGDGRDDLAVGIQENGTGAVNVLYGTDFGIFPFLDFDQDQTWTQDIATILDSSEIGDSFGGGLVGSSGIGSSGFSGAWGLVTHHLKLTGEKEKSTIDATLLVTNPGTDLASASVVRFYLSSDETLSSDGLLLEQTQLDPLAPGTTTTVELRAKVKKGQIASGMYLIAVLDADNDVPEVNEANNFIVFGPIT